MLCGNLWTQEGSDRWKLFPTPRPSDFADRRINRRKMVTIADRHLAFQRWHAEHVLGYVAPRLLRDRSGRELMSPSFYVTQRLDLRPEWLPITPVCLALLRFLRGKLEFERGRVAIQRVHE
jgi:hypothetical protein